MIIKQIIGHSLIKDIRIIIQKRFYCGYVLDLCMLHLIHEFFFFPEDLIQIGTSGLGPVYALLISPFFDIRMITCGKDKRNRFFMPHCGYSSRSL